MRLGRGGGLLALAASLGACYAERERLDTPVVELTLNTRQVAAGDSIRGTLEAYATSSSD